MLDNSSALALVHRASRHQMRQGLNQERCIFGDNLWAATVLWKSLVVPHGGVVRV